MEKAEVLLSGRLLFPFYMYRIAARRRTVMGKQYFRPGNMLYPLPAVMELSEARREAEYYYGGLGRDRLFFSGHGVHLGPKGTLFL